MAGFREHRERLALEQAQDKALKGQIASVANVAYSSVEIVLHNELNKIKAMPTLAERTEYKRLQFLPKFLPLVEEYFKAGEHYQNDVIGYCLMYLFDTGALAEGLALAEKAVKDGQSMPDGIHRTMPAFVADSILRWAEIETAKGESSEPYFGEYLPVVFNNRAISEIVQAKWLKFAAQLVLQARQHKGEVKTAFVNEYQRLELAVKLLHNASQLNFKIGVKSIIERIFMRLRALIEFGAYSQAKLDTLQGGLTGLLDVEFQQVKHYLQAPPLSFDEAVEAYQGE